MTALEDAAREAAEAKFPISAGRGSLWSMDMRDAFVAGYLTRPIPTVEQIAESLIKSLSEDMSIGPLSDSPYRYAEVNDDGVLELFETPGDWPQMSIDIPQLAAEVHAFLTRDIEHLLGDVQ